MKKSSILIAAALACVATVFMGCSIIESTRHEGLKTESGLAYYLPKGLLKLTVASTITNLPGATAVSVTNSYVLVDVLITPDRDAMYMLKMTPSAMADDSMKLVVTNGLLQTVSLTNADQSLGVVSNLALAAVNAYKLTATGGATAAGNEGRTTTNVFLVDPFDADGRSRVAGMLRTNYAVTLDFSDFTGAARPVLPTNTAGIYYRPLQPYRISWSSPPAGTSDGIVYFPNASPVLSLEVSRAAFVSQSYMIDFQQGVPVQVAYNKPSQALAISTLPITLVSSIASIPTNLIQLRLNYDNANNQLLAAQAAQSSNLLNAMQAQQKLNYWVISNSPAAPLAAPAPAAVPPVISTNVPGTVGGNTDL